DVRFRLLEDVNHALKHNTEVKLFVGAAEVLSRVRLLGAEILQPGDRGWLQLEVREPVVVQRGDRYILRRPSPGETLGGGTVVDPHPKGRHKRFSPGLIIRLESLAEGTPADIFLQSLITLSAAPVREVVQNSNLDNAAAREAVNELFQRKEIVPLEVGTGDLSIDSNHLITYAGYWDQLTSLTLKIVEDYHANFPLRQGMPKEELKSRLNIASRLFSGLMKRLISEDQLQESGPLVLIPGHTIRFSPEQEQSVQSLLMKFAAAPYAPPSVKDAKLVVSNEVFQALVENNLLILVSSEVVFRREDYDRMLVEVKSLFEQQGTLSAAQVRDHFDTSRRYVLAFLEHLDEVGLTIREGDVRRLK
ncbi:MAG: SelB C-terminal domain-containing protein, partial [Chloroflexota bacterium]